MLKRIPIEDWKTEAILVQEVSELPEWFNSKLLFLDLETTSEDDKEHSKNPWHHCKLLGIAIVIDDMPNPYYIPVRHRGSNRYNNLPLEPVLRWLQKVLNGADKWINHNIKYDAHVLMNEGLKITPTLIDSLTLCKLAPRVEQFQYGLTLIMEKWIGRSIKHYEDRIHCELRDGKSMKQDYGLVSIKEMCPYACVDVLSVRGIYHYLRNSLPAECQSIVDLEIAVTEVLFQMERTGMSLDLDLLNTHKSQLEGVLLALIPMELEKLTGYSDFKPHTNYDCHILIHDRYGLETLEWTEKNKPSYSSDAIRAYKALDPEHADVYDWIIKYKEWHKLYTSFTLPYLAKHVDGRVHCDYNQVVRTGRTSCRTPNMQQLSPEAKEYIVPSAPDREIVDIDFSQIEFRLIAHYIKAEKIIQKYQEDPNADYHQVVADMCGIPRKPAKNINFMMGYGGGRGKCIQMLAANEEIILELKTKKEIEKKANEVFERYHRMVPTLKRTSYRASSVMRRREFVKTIMGRRRYLPRKAFYKAFNSVIQGSAADLFKAALVRLASVLPSEVDLIGAVHDSFVLETPVGYDVSYLKKVIEELPEGVELRVPIRADSKSSSVNWRECS